MLADTPAGVVAEVLAERRKEYSEYIARLEDERAAAAQRLRDVDERIAQAERERRAIEWRIMAEEEKGEEEVAEKEEEISDEYEMDDVPRLRRLALELRGHYSGITALDHDAARGLIATGALDTQARVWDAATGACKHVVGGHGDAAVRGVQLHAGFLLTGGNDGRVRMWDLAQLDSALPPELCCQTTFAGHSGAVTCFHAHGGTLVSGSADRTVREWDLATGAERQTIDVAWEARDIGGNYGGDEGTARGDGGFVGALQVFGFAMATGTADGVLRLWDLRTAQAHRRLAGHHAQPITALGFDDRHVVSGAMDGAALLWDLRMGRVVQTLAFARPVTAVQLVAVRRAAAAAAAAECWVAAGDGCVHRYQAASMQRMAYAATGSQAAVVSRVHCRDGETLLSGDSEGTVRVWKI
ncbi:Mitochondrial fission protein [Coemansia sp. RSA 2052]|nr:Mitochondrial fission protein [Coemansia sp. RSA 2052]